MNHRRFFSQAFFWSIVSLSLGSGTVMVTAFVPAMVTSMEPPRNVLHTETTGSTPSLLTIRSTRRSSSSSTSTSTSSRWMTNGSPSDPEKEEDVITTQVLPSIPTLQQRKVAVTGATGRTGAMVVKELLGRGLSVVAMVRSLEKAEEVLGSFKNEANDSLSISKVDLTSSSQVQTALEGCDAVIWCATGFSDSPETNWLEKIKRLMGIALVPVPKISIDAVGIPLVAKAMLCQPDVATEQPRLPQVIMLSSAGVTRPSWTDDKKKRLEGCADIPIVRLNPFGILDIKAASEQSLRESGVQYCVVRPTGLNDQWPSGSRPVVSQGDVAVGRINRQDVAKVLCDLLYSPHACQKTFEVLALAGYPPARTVEPFLERLVTDIEGLTEEQVEANFALLQQLLPGEVQDAAKLAMGQTYEQLDSGTTGRLGERGQEDAEAAAPKPTSNI